MPIAGDQPVPPGQYIRLLDPNGLQYISSVPSDPGGAWAMPVPATTYSLYYGPSRTGPWTLANPAYHVTDVAADKSIDVKVYGAAGDGVTDDSAAIQSAINAGQTAGGGVVYLPPGTYVLKTSLVPASKVSIIGAGIAKSILQPQGAVAAIFKAFTSGAPLTDVTMAEFEIDGSGQSGTYSSGIKGIYVGYHLRCTYRDLYIHDTGASGLGVDFMQYCVITRVYTNNCGRLNDGTKAGGNGIGIGTGGYAVEPCVISDCHAYGNKRYGIYLERGTATVARGYRVVGCHSENNNIGFADCGTDGTIWDGCVGVNNVSHGFSADIGTINTGSAVNGLIVGCIFRANSGAGINLDTTNQTTLGRYSVRACKIHDNILDGVKINPATACGGFQVTDCDIHGNGSAGVNVAAGGGTLTNLDMSRNMIYNNGSTVANPGILINNSFSRGQIKGNVIFDDQGTQTQTYAVVVQTSKTVTQCDVTHNDFRNNLTGAFLVNGTLTSSRTKDNSGYNPQGATSISVGASPFTYTAGLSPEALYISAGTVSAVVKNSTTVFSASPCTVYLQPQEQVIVTYSSAPTMIADRK